MNLTSILKHLPGKHDQKTHGRKITATIENAKPIINIGGAGAGVKPSNKTVSALKRKLDADKLIGDQAQHDPDLDRILTEGKSWRYSYTSSVDTLPGNDAECHWNVAKAYKSGQVDQIVIGYTSKLGAQYYQHTFGLKNGKVVETTEANYMNRYYYGLPLSKDEADAFVAHTEANPPGAGKVRRVP